MPKETFTTTSGKEITVNVSEDGEPENVSWIDGEGKHQLSENELSEIYEYVFEDGGDD